MAEGPGGRLSAGRRCWNRLAAGRFLPSGRGNSCQEPSRRCLLGPLRSLSSRSRRPPRRPGSSRPSRRTLISRPSWPLAGLTRASPASARSWPLTHTSPTWPRAPSARTAWRGFGSGWPPTPVATWSRWGGSSTTPAPRCGARLGRVQPCRSTSCWRSPPTRRCAWSMPRSPTPASRPTPGSSSSRTARRRGCARRPRSRRPATPRRPTPGSGPWRRTRTRTSGPRWPETPMRPWRCCCA